MSTVAASVTGFGFPFDHLLPSHKVGILSLLVLAVAIVARYVFHSAGCFLFTPRSDARHADITTSRSAAASP